MRLGKTAKIVIAVAIVLVVVAIAIVAYPGGGPKDSDGDGVLDVDDSSPYDPNVWNWGNATVNVTVHNHLVRTVRFTVLTSFEKGHSTGQWWNDTKTNDTYSKPFVVRWPMGPNSTNLTVIVSAMPYQKMNQTDLESSIKAKEVVVTNGLDSILSFTYPDEFPQ